MEKILSRSLSSEETDVSSELERFEETSEENEDVSSESSKLSLTEANNRAGDTGER